MAKKPGQPAFKPTEEQHKIVEQMAAVGIPHEGIAAVIGIDDKTLRKHFRATLDTASVKANAKIGGTLYNKAVGGDTTAAIWWSKARMGWKEKHDVDTTFRVEIGEKDAETL
ncbi:MAG: hypothetical protein KAI73_06295 [Rhodospirillaceae bacterium]|nr:hypothetical protein [Rhodospirillaceae bacterium]